MEGNKRSRPPVRDYSANASPTQGVSGAKDSGAGSKIAHIVFDVSSGQPSVLGASKSSRTLPRVDSLEPLRVREKKAMVEAFPDPNIVVSRTGDPDVPGGFDQSDFDDFSIRPGSEPVDIIGGITRGLRELFTPLIPKLVEATNPKPVETPSWMTDSTPDMMNTTEVPKVVWDVLDIALMAGSFGGISLSKKAIQSIFKKRSLVQSAKATVDDIYEFIRSGKLPEVSSKVKPVVQDAVEGMRNYTSGATNVGRGSQAVKLAEQLAAKIPKAVDTTPRALKLAAGAQLGTSGAVLGGVGYMLYDALQRGNTLNSFIDSVKTADVTGIKDAIGITGASTRPRTGLTAANAAKNAIAAAEAAAAGIKAANVVDTVVNIVPPKVPPIPTPVPPVVPPVVPPYPEEGIVATPNVDVDIPFEKKAGGGGSGRPTGPTDVPSHCPLHIEETLKKHGREFMEHIDPECIPLVTWAARNALKIKI